MVVGLSGGPDSMCLFDVFCDLAKDMDWTLHPVHVNHKFRPGAAEEDQEFVEAFCLEKGWPCTTFVVDCMKLAQEQGMTSEEAGRTARYDAFRQVADRLVGEGIERDRVAIAVAQNANDQCETILFRILRGTGVDGLAGIAYQRYDESGTSIIRPLMDASREEIEAYCKEQDLKPRMDHTNQEAIYMRNRIRLELIPELKKYNENLVETINRLGRSAAADKAYLNQQAQLRLEELLLSQKEEGEVVLSLKGLRNEHEALRVRMYHLALKKVGLKENVTAAHLEGIEKIVFSENSSAQWNLPQSYVAEKAYDQLRFRFLDTVKEEEEKGTLKVWTEPSAIFEGGDGLIGRFDLKKLEEAYGEDVGQKLTLRHRQDGDFLTIATGSGLHRKKLQDLLVDMKVPRPDRDRLWMVAVGSEILWILPMKGSDGWKSVGGLKKQGRFTASYRAVSQDAHTIILEYSV